MLRDYQQNFKQNIRLSLAHSKKIIACAATGSGKTKTFISITKDAIAAKRTVVLLTESRKIFVQIAAEVECVEVAAGADKEMFVASNKVYVCMAQTLAKRPKIIDQLQRLEDKLLIINDEAHIGTATKLLLQLPKAYLIGFTATPDYECAKHLPKLYNGIVVGPQPQELVEMGFLSPYYHFSREANTSALKVDNTGEFTEESQYTAFATTKVFAGLFEDLQKVEFKKAIIFCSSIKHCQDVTKQLRSVGYQCSEVHSQNQAADIELSEFMNGDNNICVSVGILTKGFDFPQIDLVVLLRATTSLALYCQMIGRGSRIAPDKKRFTVLDYGENGRRHMLWNYEHDWGTKWMKPDKKKKKGEGEGVAPVKECPKCMLLVAPKVMTCPECGHQWKAKEKGVEEGELIELTDQMNELRGRYIGELAPKDLASYAKITNKKAFAIRVAKAQGEEFLKEFAREMGYKPNWVNHQDISQPIDFYNILIK